MIDRNHNLPPIQRHKTAIRRPGYSLPVKCLLRDGLLEPGRTLFDYGCGRGQDLELLQELNISAAGWDPAFRPQAPRTPAQVVNLGYVINVVEDPAERAQVLQQAWELAEELLVVSAQIVFSSPLRDQPRHGDGVLTSRGTFQHYYTQQELREFLEQHLEADAIPAAPGVFYLFRDEVAKQGFLAQRYRRREVVPPRRTSERLYEQHRDLLDPFMERLAQLGRLPFADELPDAPVLIERLGSIKRAFALVRRVTDEAPWEQIARHRTEDLLVYLALSRFKRRPQLSKLPLDTQRDIKAFFGTYQRACGQADDLLFSVGDPANIDAACQQSPLGHLVENALLVPAARMSELEPILRVYEGCAHALVGDIEGVNVTKLHRHSGKVSYLRYATTPESPTPVLQFRVKVSLRALTIEYFDHR